MKNEGSHSKPIEIGNKTAEVDEFRTRKVSGGISMLDTSFMEQYETISQPKKKEESKKVAEQTPPMTTFDFQPVAVPRGELSKPSGLSMAFSSLSAKEVSDLSK